MNNKKIKKVEHKRSLKQNTSVCAATVCVKGTEVSRGLVLSDNICQTQYVSGELIYGLFGQEAV